MFLLFSLFARFIRIWKKNFFRSKELPVRFHILFSALIILFISHTILAPWLLFKNVQEFLFGYPDYFIIGSIMGYLLIPLSIGFGYFLWRMWKNRLGSLFSRFYLTIVEASLIIHILFLFYWNFI